MVHQRTQNLVIIVFRNLLIGYQKSLHHSDLFFIFAHVSSGDVSKAFSKFPLGIYVPQEKVAPWQVFWELLQGIGLQLGGTPAISACPPPQNHCGCHLYKDVNFPAVLLCASSSSAFFVYSSSVNSSENFLSIRVDKWFSHSNFAEEKVLFSVLTELDYPGQYGLGKPPMVLCSENLE